MKISRFVSRVSIQPSRLWAGRPVTSVWCPGSIKSGPTLKAWTVSPRRTRAAMRARLTVVFPAPLMCAGHDQTLDARPARIFRFLFGHILLSVAGPRICLHIPRPYMNVNLTRDSMVEG